jgi:hypothetical protein
MHPYDWELFGSYFEPDENINEHGNCKRCKTDRDEDVPAVDHEGLCGHCYWAIKAEVHEGIQNFYLYLEASPMVGYTEACRRRGIPA